MELEDIEQYLQSHGGCQPRKVAGRIGWYVEGLLVMRPDVPGTILIRVPHSHREQLLIDYPETFGVPPRWEAHDKVQAQLAGDSKAIKLALSMAWEYQRAKRNSTGGL